MAAGTQGTISQVIGSTFDAQFPEDSLPEIYNALEITWNQDGQDMKLVGEVQQHLGGGRVRAVALRLAALSSGVVSGQWSSPATHAALCAPSLGADEKEACRSFTLCEGVELS